MIKRHETAFVFDGQSKKIYIRDMFAVEDDILIKKRVVKKADIVFPEYMCRLIAHVTHFLSYLYKRLWVGVLSIAHDPNHTVLCVFR